MNFLGLLFCSFVAVLVPMLVGTGFHLRFILFTLVVLIYLYLQRTDVRERFLDKIL